MISNKKTTSFQEVVFVDPYFFPGLVGAGAGFAGAGVGLTGAGAGF